MRKYAKKKTIAIITALCMLMTITSGYVFAEDEFDDNMPSTIHLYSEEKAKPFYPGTSIWFPGPDPSPNNAAGGGGGDLYTIINGAGKGYTLDYPGLNNRGDIFPISVTHVATGDVFVSFCAHPGSTHFAGDNNQGCQGYLVAAPIDNYSDFLSAYNYIADNYGKIDEEGNTANLKDRALTQVVTWALLGAVDVNSPAFDAIADWKVDKAAAKDVMANYKGYTGKGTIAELVYLVCELGHDPHDCQPQLFPKYRETPPPPSIKVLKKVDFECSNDKCTCEVCEAPDASFSFVYTITPANGKLKDIQTKFKNIKAGESFKLSGLPDGFTGAVTINELILIDGNLKNIKGWEFDKSIYVFTFEDSSLSGSTKDGKIVKLNEGYTIDNNGVINVTFTNKYKCKCSPDEVTPDPIKIVKKSQNRDGTFRAGNFQFGVNVNKETLTGTPDITLDINTSSTDFVLFNMDDHLAAFPVFKNFNGFITIREINSGITGWTYDPSVYVFYYEGGQLDSVDKMSNAGAEQQVFKTREQIEAMENDIVEVIFTNSYYYRNEDGDGDGDGDGDRDGDSTTRLSDPDVPLAEPLVILDEEVPLANIPQTGINSIALNIALLGLALSAMAAIFVTRRKQEE